MNPRVGAQNATRNAVMVNQRRLVIGGRINCYTDYQRAAGSASQVSQSSEDGTRMARLILIAYLTFIAAVVVWVLLAVSYGIAPGCAVGSDWVRSTCFLLPTWRFFA